MEEGSQSQSHQVALLGGGGSEVQARPGQLCKETGERASRPTSVPLPPSPSLESAPRCLSASASFPPETAKACTITLEKVLSGL